jgi:hypothetical protein
MLGESFLRQAIEGVGGSREGLFPTPFRLELREKPFRQGILLQLWKLCGFGEGLAEASSDQRSFPAKFSTSDPGRRRGRNPARA